MKKYINDWLVDGESKGFLGHIILWLTLLFVVVFIVWAYFSQVDEVTVAVGKVIPSSHVQLIQNLEGGIVKKIWVKEGDLVEKDQVIISLDDTRFKSEYQEVQTQTAALKIKQIRLFSEVHGEVFDIPEDFKNTFPNLVRSEKALYFSHKDELEGMQANLRLAESELEMTEPLLEKGSVSKIEILRLQQKVSELSRSVANFKSSTIDELSKVNAQIQNLSQKNLALKDRVERTAVRSPVRGIVKQIYVSTIGGVVKPGMNLAEVVPLDDTLLVEGRVRPSDIAFIHKGQEAFVKLTSYDFSIYGSLKAKVEYISADTSVDDDGHSFYEIWVRTNRNYLGTKAKPFNIKVGMQANINILTGQKSVLSYLLKPIIKAKQVALTER